MDWRLGGEPQVVCKVELPTNYFEINPLVRQYSRGKWEGRDSCIASPRAIRGYPQIDSRSSMARGRKGHI